MQYNLKGFRGACAYLNYTLTKLFIREAEQSGNDATVGREGGGGGRGRGKQLIRMNLSRNSAPTLAVSPSRSFCASQRIFSSASKCTLIPYRGNFLIDKGGRNALRRQDCVGELIKKEDPFYFMRGSASGRNTRMGKSRFWIPAEILFRSCSRMNIHWYAPLFIGHDIFPRSRWIWCRGTVPVPRGE